MIVGLASLDFAEQAYRLVTQGHVDVARVEGSLEAEFLASSGTSVFFS